MKIYAQHGYGPKDKIERGLQGNMIQGAILSPKYLTPPKMNDQIVNLCGNSGNVLIDPEFYAAPYIGKPNAHLGSLEVWEHFASPRRSALIAGTAIRPTIEVHLKSQSEYPVSAFVSPNLYVQKADSINAAVALNFISQAKKVAKEMGDKEVYATLALDRDVLNSDRAFHDLLDALTSLEVPPDGFYVLIGSGVDDNLGRQVRSDLYDDHVIAGWMMINHVLSINGFKVVNACSDMLSPLLGVCGAYAGATGWFSNLRQFTMGRYIKAEKGGGSQPLIRYVSVPLMSRIKLTDFTNYAAVLPIVANRLPTDSYYAEEPTRTEEVLQCWEALTALSNDAITGDIESDLSAYERRIDQANTLWSDLMEQGFSQDIEAHLEKLNAILQGVRLFRQWAEMA